ncbi:hypothetical protein [Streptomyces sp. NBC_00306]|uniref:hypothetical protein n=1 Tax=Streptomyces sp. NBC_00306 TaxID=2975708 RepID=UPI002E29169E|nr:hypothetical protein [Streptomyces sp. NBC_00306]
MTRLTTATRYPADSMTRCGEIDPERPKVFCTHEDPQHLGDHYNEYSGCTWPRAIDH